MRRRVRQGREADEGGGDEKEEEESRRRGVGEGTQGEQGIALPAEGEGRSTR